MTSRRDVRAACSGATRSNASAARIFVPPATWRAGTARRAIPTIPLNTYVPPGTQEMFGWLSRNHHRWLIRDVSGGLVNSVSRTGAHGARPSELASSLACFLCQGGTFFGGALLGNLRDGQGVIK